MFPPPDPPASTPDAYEEFWAAVDSELGDEPPAVVPHGPAPMTDAYAEFSDLAET